MKRRDIYGSVVKKEWQDINIHDDFELNELEDEEDITIYDIDNVLGYTVDIFKVGFPFLFLVALFLGLIYIAGILL